MEEICYEVIRSSRKTMAIQIMPDGSVTVRAPRRCSRAAIEGFVLEKQNWIQEKQNLLQRRRQQQETVIRQQEAWSAEEYRKARELAGQAFRQKAELYARIMQVDYGRITVRDQKTRWGSCSAAGNLNFNWRLILAPEGVLDYVVVHELAHRREMNHSARFWAVVESVLPEYRKPRGWLKQNGDGLMLR